MTVVKPDPLAPSVTLHARGVAYVRKQGDKHIASKWPKKRGRPKTPYDRWRQAEFGYAAKMASNPHPLDLQSAQQLAKRTMMVPRDLLMRCIFGLQYIIILNDGTVLRSWRDMVPSVQLLLEQLTYAPGAMIYRDTDFWTALLPGLEGQIIAMVDGIPQWVDAAGATHSGAWALIDRWDYAGVPVPYVDFTALHKHTDLAVVAQGLTASGASYHGLQLSTDGGASFYSTAAAYLNWNDEGTSSAGDSAVNTSVSTSATARTWQAYVRMAPLAGSLKWAEVRRATGSSMVTFNGSTDAVDALRILPFAPASNWSAGSISLFGRG